MPDQTDELINAVSEFVKPLALKLDGDRPPYHSTEPVREAAQVR